MFHRTPNHQPTGSPPPPSQKKLHYVNSFVCYCTKNELKSSKQKQSLIFSRSKKTDNEVKDSVKNPARMSRRAEKFTSKMKDANITNKNNAMRKFKTLDCFR